MGKLKYKDGSNEVAGPSRKEAATLMRSYNKTNKNNPNVIGSIDDEEFITKEKTLKALEATGKSKAPIISKPMVGPSNEELQTGRIREDAEKARKTYEDKQLKSSFESDVLGKTVPTLKNMSTEKNPILYKEPIKNPYISFKQMSAADRKLYRAGMASGKDFKVGGRDYKAATKEEQAVSARMAGKGKLKSTKQSENYKPNVEYNKPESLTDITRKQILTKDTSVRTSAIKNKINLPKNALSGMSNFSGTGVPTKETQKAALDFEKKNPKTAFALSATIPVGAGGGLASSLLKEGLKKSIPRLVAPSIKNMINQGGSSAPKLTQAQIVQQLLKEPGKLKYAAKKAKELAKANLEKTKNAIYQANNNFK